MPKSTTPAEVSRYINQMVQDSNLDPLVSLKEKLDSAIDLINENRRKADEERRSKKLDAIAANCMPLAKEVGSFEPATLFAVNTAVRQAAQEFFYGNDNDLVPFMCSKYADLDPVADKDACMTYAIELARRCILTAQDNFYKFWMNCVDSDDTSDTGLARSMYSALYGLVQNGYNMFRKRTAKGRQSTINLGFATFHT